MVEEAMGVKISANASLFEANHYLFILGKVLSKRILEP
jgi:hypothetical protein